MLSPDLAAQPFQGDPAVRYSNLDGGEIWMDAYFAPKQIQSCGGDFCTYFDGEPVCDDVEFYCLNLESIRTSIPKDLDRYIAEARIPENNGMVSWDRDGLRYNLALVIGGQRSKFAHHNSNLALLGLDVPVVTIVTTNQYAEPRDWHEISTVRYSPAYGILYMSGNAGEDSWPPVYLAVGRCGYLATHPDCKSVTTSAAAAQQAQDADPYAASFDPNQPIRIEGEVKNVQWHNPRAWLIVIAQDADSSAPTEFAVMLPSVSMLERRGWSEDRLAPGDIVVIEGIRAVDGKPRAMARQVFDAAGESLLDLVAQPITYARDGASLILRAPQ